MQVMQVMQVTRNLQERSRDIPQEAKILSSIRCPLGMEDIMHIQCGHAWWHPHVLYQSGIDAHGVKWWKYRSLTPDEVLPPPSRRIDGLCKVTKKVDDKPR
jgi:hypothetical protein